MKLRQQPLQKWIMKNTLRGTPLLSASYNIRYAGTSKLA